MEENMNKILVICTNVFGYNGIAGVILNYYKAIDKQKMHIDMLLINEPSDDVKQLLKDNGSELYVVKRNSNPMRYMHKIEKIMRENKYDLVHIHGNSATMAVELMAAKRAGVPVRIPHSHNTTSDHMSAHKLLKPIFNKNYSYGFACGNEAGKWLYGDRDFVVINNGVDTDKFQYNEDFRDEIRRKYGVKDKFVVGHIGVFNYQKNHEILIEIFRRLHRKNPNSVLMLIGEGENVELIKEIVREEKLENDVIFVGTTDKANKYMMAFDVLALPSRFEGLPLVLVEAQCSGLPCVVSTNVSIESNITGLVEYVDYDKEIDKFVERLNIVSVKERDRASIADEAIKTIKLKGYSINDNAKRMEELFKVYIDNAR